MSHSPSLSAEAVSVLNRLRARIRTYVLWEGLALVVIVLGSLFWASFFVDWAYFQLSRLELPRWFRAFILFAGIGLVAAGVFSWIALRLFRRLRAKSLALVLERRFPELDDRLVTAVEAAEGRLTVDSPATSFMLERALNDVARLAGQLDVGSVFDRRPLRRAAVIAVGLVGSILGLMVVDSAAMERWAAGYLALQDNYWTRQTELVLRVVVPPGDQLRDFTDGRYRHPKGGDLTLQIEVPEGKTRPDRIRLDSRMGRGLTQIWLTPSADGQFHHTFIGLIEDARLWVSGGDYSHSIPYSVDVVPPPEVKQVVLNCRYPEYTGLNQRSASGQLERTANELKGAQLSLPMQTDLRLQVTANKPLLRARLEGDAGSDRWEIELNADASRMSAATLMLKSQDGKSLAEVPLPWSPAECWSDQSTAFMLPLVLAPDGATRLPQLIRDAQAGQSLTLPIPIPPDSLLRVTLEDADQIISPAPTRFTVNAIVDQPPVVETRLKGIGSSVTRKARIPIVGTISDDYGIAAARFEYRIDEDTDWKPRDLAVPPREQPREFVLERSDSEAYERFDVLPLDLANNQRLTLTVAADDACTVPSVTREGGLSKMTAHHALGLKYTFTIISEEELLSMLYNRELNLRKRVEQIVTECQSSLQELQTQHDKLAVHGFPAGSAQTDEHYKEVAVGLNVAADRSLHGVRKNAVETSGVETAFAEIREELVNNAADTPAMLERLDQKILVPLNAVNSTRFPNVDGALGLFKLALEKGTDPTVSLETSIDELTNLIQQLQAVLGKMAELARFDAVLEDLKKTIKAEMDLLEQTKRLRKERAIKALEE